MTEKLILLVDDDEDIADTIRMILARDGWRVDWAADGEAGLARLRAGLKPRLVLLDMMMPGLNGWDFCRTLNADPSLRDTPVVVISGGGDLAEDARQLGACGHLRKPFELSELTDVVNSVT